MAQGQRRGAGFARERYGWIALSVLLVALIVGLVFQNIRLKEREDLRVKPETLQERSSLRSWEIANLQKNGLPDPEKDLVADLMQHSELIPYEGVMGGTMGFYSKKDIHILSSRWVLASFEDGHIGGRMLLEYRVDPGGKIHWRVIVAYLD
jgi:hypothetical protein